jgi:hypothetical protein
MPEPLAPVDIGDVLPAVTLKNEKDEDIQVADLAAERGVVLFLVPKADTRESWPHAFSSCSKTDPRAPPSSSPSSLFRSRVLFLSPHNGQPDARPKLVGSGTSTKSSPKWAMTCTA